MTATPEKNESRDMKIPCIKCNNKTWHKSIKLYQLHESSPHGEWEGWDSYMIVECQGCKTISFLHESTSTDDIDYDPETGDEKLIPTRRIYPNRIVGRPIIDDVHFVPGEIQQIYKETHQCLCNNLNILSGIGIRAIIEAICKEKVAAGRNLKEQIDDLVGKGVITRDGAEILHNLRFMGNEAAHEIKAPSADELKIAFNIVEYLLKGVYILPRQAEGLSKKKRS